MGELLRIDAGREQIEFGGTENEILAAMQQAVGGYIEVIKLHDGRFMVFNDEGPMRNLPLNALASGLAHQSILGNAIVLSSEEADRYLGRPS
jgi:hypothetical protein